MELLLWEIFVTNYGFLKAETFKNLQANDIIRLGLSRLNITLEVPSHLKNLSELSKQNYWDGPDSITKIRNHLVHPGHKKGSKIVFDDCLTDAWALGMWYLEIIFLHFFDFEGKYLNRTYGYPERTYEREIPWGSSLPFLPQN